MVSTSRTSGAVQAIAALAERDGHIDARAMRPVVGDGGGEDLRGESPGDVSSTWVRFVGHNRNLAIYGMSLIDTSAADDYACAVDVRSSAT